MSAKTFVETPPQHQEPPGVEALMHPRPVEEDERYRGSGKLQDKRAIVTGGDSGIGAAVAIAFAKEGADMVIVHRSERERPDAQRTSDRVRELGRTCEVMEGDLQQRAFCKEVVDRCVDGLGGLDVLVNHAGDDGVHDTLEEIPEGEMEELFRDNFFSMYHLTRAALPFLGKGASIVNTTSITAYQGSSTHIDYSATKGAIVAFTRSLAGSLAERGIRVNGVAPGPVWTPLTVASGRRDEQVESFGKGNPMGRPAQPWEIAPSYVFLASDIDSSFMTGQVLHPNGGRWMSS